MNTIDVHRCAMLVRVKEFGAAHAELFPRGSVAAQTLAAVRAAADQLNAYGTSEARGLRAASGSATRKAIARESLRSQLDAIARTAAVLPDAGSRLEGKFHTRGVQSDHTLVTVARAFVNDLAPLAAEFVAHGMPKSVHADLQAAVQAFEDATKERAGARDAHVTAHAGITVTMNTALAAVARLDAVVTNTLRDNPTLLAAWVSARRVERVRAAEPPAAPAPIPAVAAAPARPPAVAAPATAVPVVPV
jgi:hypothetical protein